MYGEEILCGISKTARESPHNISYLYIETYDLYTIYTI